MSYIRNTQSPEALHIYGGPNETLHIDVYLDGPKFFAIPQADWDELLKEYWEKELDEAIVIGDLMLKEVMYETCFKIELFYKNELVSSMWDVTWEYIANHGK